MRVFLFKPFLFHFYYKECWIAIRWKWLLVFFILLASCRKYTLKDSSTPKPQELPPITTEGKNTFGCRVDGEVWLPTGAWLMPAISSDHLNWDFFVHTNGLSKTGVSFYIGNVVFKEGEYVLKKYDDTTGRGIYRNDSLFYYTDNSHTGKLTLLRLDTINFIVSGTFYFDAYDSLNHQLIHITDGRFDIKYH